MANALTQNPLRIDTTMGSSFRNTAAVIAVPGLARGIRPCKVVWLAPGTGATFSITDGGSPAITLLQGSTPGSFAGQDPEYDFESIEPTWRDFLATISAGTLQIFYRN